MSREKILAAINKAADKTSASRERKSKKGTATSYTEVWNLAVLDFFGREFCIAPTIKTTGMMKRAIDRLPVSEVSAKNAFIRWAVEHWIENAAHVAWKKGKYPETPELSLFIVAIERLYFAYCRKDQTKVGSGSSNRKVAALEKTITDLQKTIADRDEQIRKMQFELNKKNARIKLLTARG